jgi:cell division protein FtsB
MNRSNDADARDREGRKAPEPDRDPVVRRQMRRFWSHAMLFIASVLLVNGLFGERGLMQTIRARRAFAAAARDLARLKQDNAVLRDRARRLRSDPATIESVAREELGLMRRGEILVTVKDVK